MRLTLLDRSDVYPVVYRTMVRRIIKIIVWFLSLIMWTNTYSFPAVDSSSLLVENLDHQVTSVAGHSDEGGGG